MLTVYLGSLGDTAITTNDTIFEVMPEELEQAKVWQIPCTICALFAIDTAKICANVSIVKIYEMI